MIRLHLRSLLHIFKITMKQSTSSFDFKALSFNIIIVLLCAAPYIGWACFILLIGMYLVSVRRFARTKGMLLTSVAAIATAAFVYFSAYGFNKSTHDMPDYFLGVAVIQFAVVLALVLLFHFKIYKPNKEFIKAGV
jgi:hypothetical protein